MDEEFNFIISDYQLVNFVSYTENEIEDAIDAALSAVVCDNEQIHVATHRHADTALCGKHGEPALYFAPVFDLTDPDFCDECVVWKLMES